MKALKILLQSIMAISCLYFFTVHVVEQPILYGVDLSFIFPFLIVGLAAVALQLIKK